MKLEDTPYTQDTALPQCLPSAQRKRWLKLAKIVSKLVCVCFNFHYKSCCLAKLLTTLGWIQAFLLVKIEVRRLCYGSWDMHVPKPCGFYYIKEDNWVIEKDSWIQPIAWVPYLARAGTSDLPRATQGASSLSKDLKLGFWYSNSTLWPQCHTVVRRCLSWALVREVWFTIQAFNLVCGPKFGNLNCSAFFLLRERPLYSCGEEIMWPPVSGKASEKQTTLWWLQVQ